MIYNIVKVYFSQRDPISKKAGYFPQRFDLFERYTLKSLEAQTFKGFVVWIHCQKGMEAILSPLKTKHPEFVFTFGEHFPERLPDKTKLLDSTLVYMTRIDSDDLYRCDALELLNRKSPIEPGRVEASMFTMGYIFDLRTKRLGWYKKASQPFHTLMFPTEIFLDKDLYEKNFVGDHSMVAGRYRTQGLPPFRFCVLIHGLNCGSSFENRGARIMRNENFSPERFIHGAYNLRS